MTSVVSGAKRQGLIVSNLPLALREILKGVDAHWRLFAPGHQEGPLRKMFAYAGDLG